MKDQAAGPMKLRLHQFGLIHPDEVAVQAYSEAAHLESFVINAGDAEGILKGSRLDEVERFELKETRFVPAKPTRPNEKDELRPPAKHPTPPPLHPLQLTT